LESHIAGLIINCSNQVLIYFGAYYSSGRTFVFLAGTIVKFKIGRIVLPSEWGYTVEPREQVSEHNLSKSPTVGGMSTPGVRSWGNVAVAIGKNVQPEQLPQAETQQRATQKTHGVGQTFKPQGVVHELPLSAVLALHEHQFFKQGYV
jgi:hypothetical protein